MTAFTIVEGREYGLRGVEERVCLLLYVFFFCGEDAEDINSSSVRKVLSPKEWRFVLFLSTVFLHTSTVNYYDDEYHSLLRRNICPF